MTMFRSFSRWLVTCAAGLLGVAVSAQGLTWTTLELGMAYNNTTCPMGQIASEKGAALRVSLTFPTAVPTQGEVVCMEGTMASGIGGIVLTAGGRGHLTAILCEASGTFALAGQGAVLLPGENEVAIAVDRGSAEAGYPVRIAVFVNGAEAFFHEGTMSGVTFNKITVGRGYDGATDAPWDVADATISGRFARADTVVDACRKEFLPQDLSINFASAPLATRDVVGIEPVPGVAWLAMGAEATVSAPLGGRSVRVSATGALEGEGDAPLLGKWLGAEPAVRVEGLPAGLYTVVVYCGGDPADTVGFRAVLVASDRLPETPFADLRGAAVTAAREDGFGRLAAGPRLGRNVLRVNNVPVGEGGHLVIRAQPDDEVQVNGALGGRRRGTLAAVQILRRDGLTLELGQSLRNLAHAIAFQPDPHAFEGAGAATVTFIPTAHETRQATVTLTPGSGTPSNLRLSPIGADGRVCAVAGKPTADDAGCLRVALSGMDGFDALDLPEALGLLSPGAAATVSGLTAATGLGDNEANRVSHAGGKATVAFVTGSTLPEGQMLYGGRLAKKNVVAPGDVWLGVTGGSYHWISAGDACADWSANGTPARTHEGNLVLWLRDGTAKAVAGAVYEGKNESRVRGNVLVTVEAPARVTTRIVGGMRVVNANANDRERPTIEGDVCVRVRTLLTGGDELVGGCHFDATSLASAASTITGSTRVEVEIPEETAGTFGMRIIGADLNQRDIYGTARTMGNASVCIDAPGVTFPKDIYAGCVGTNTVVEGDATLTLAGGTFTGTLAPSKFGTINGVSTLRLEGSPTLSGATVGAFDRLVVARGADVTLPDFSAVDRVELFSEGHTASIPVAGDASAYWATKAYCLNNQPARAAYADGTLTLSIGPVPADAETWPMGTPATERAIVLAEAAGIGEGEPFAVSAAALRNGTATPLSADAAREALRCFEGLRPIAAPKAAHTMAKAAPATGETVRFAYAFGVTAMEPLPEEGIVRVTVRVRNADGSPAAFAEGARLRAVASTGEALCAPVPAPAGNAGELTLTLPMAAPTRLFRVEVAPHD